MKRWLLAFALSTLCPFFIAAQSRTYTSDEIDRFASLGKLWGMLHYFHPNVLNGTVLTDSLIVPAARSLAADASAANYKRVVAAMLAATADAETKLSQVSKRVRLLTSPGKVSVLQLPGGFQYIALPSDIANMEELTKTGFMDDSWRNANGTVLDLRKADYQIQDWSEEQFVAEFMPTISAALLGKKRLPELQERYAAHNGFVSQTKTTPNVYSTGWRSTNFTDEMKGDGKGYGKPFVFVIHEQSNAQLIWLCLALEQAGVCQVVIDGHAPFGAKGRTHNITLSDGLQCQIRVSDFFTGNGQQLPEPAAVLTVQDTTLDGKLVQQCLSLLQQAPGKLGTSSNSTLRMDYVYPRPGRYSESFYPDSGLRLMGLFNWWNAIHYFFPYKHLTDVPWDSVLYSHIPIMLQAKDSIEYLFAVRSMVSHINDSHGFLYNENPVTPVRSILGYWPPVDLRFKEGRLWLTDIGIDSTQDMSQVQLWDEILKIDEVPVSQATEKWRQFIASSNESTYLRDVVRYLVNGSKDSKVKLLIRRQGIEKEVTLVRTGRSNLRSPKIDFNSRYPAIQKMQDSVLYVNMGSLTGAQADSLAKVLHQQKILLFDIRNYPQGTAWTIAPRMTTEAKKAVLFDKPLVTPSHLFGGEGKESLSSYFTVVPADSKKAFKGRVFILCNEQTQSQAEYTIMMFQGATRCTVVGSQTAGADGNVTQVAIPGGYEAWFSGLGILYPDGGQTQRKGIRVDVEVKPTVEGLKAGKDEVLEAALKLIRE
jgi:carboxyl-terminal processing protease